MTKRETPIEELNTILNGGIPPGKIVHIFGESLTGKTCLSYLISTNYKTLYINAEFSFYKEQLSFIRNDIDNVSVGTVYEFSDVKKLIIENAPLYDYIILDSLAFIYNDYISIKEFFDGLATTLQENDCTLIITNQIRDSIRSRRKKALGATSLSVYFDIVLRTYPKLKGTKQQIEVIKNKISVPTKQYFELEWKKDD